MGYLVWPLALQSQPEPIPPKTIGKKKKRENLLEDVQIRTKVYAAYKTIQRKQNLQVNIFTYISVDFPHIVYFTYHI